MSETIEVVLLGETHARELVEKINTAVEDVRTLVLELYDGQGWVALGYKTWAECVQAEFKGTRRRFYQLLDAAQIERNLCTIVHTDGEQIPETVLRPLAKLKEPEKQREAYKEATEEAKKTGKKRPTAKQVAKAAEKLAKEIPKTEAQIKAAEERSKRQDQKFAAEAMWTILFTLTAGSKSMQEQAAEAMDYTDEDFARYQLEVTKETWARAIATLRLCAAIWRRKENTNARSRRGNISGDAKASKA